MSSHSLADIGLSSLPRTRNELNLEIGNCRILADLKSIENDLEILCVKRKKSQLHNFTRKDTSSLM